MSLRFSRLIGMLLRGPRAGEAETLVTVGVPNPDQRAHTSAQQPADASDIASALNGYGESHAGICRINFRRTYTDPYDRY
jgi:hypothetical protein